MEIRKHFKMSNQIATNLSRFIKQSTFLFKLYILGLLLFFIGRSLFIFSYGNLSELSNFKADLLHSFITGIRFDTVVITYSMLLLLAMCIVNLFFKSGNTAVQRFVDKFFIYFAVFAFSFITLVSIFDFFYFKFFSSHINIMAFGILDDDTQSLLKSMWVDYPVLRILFAFIAIVFVLNKLIKHLYFHNLKLNISNRWLQSLYIFLFLAAYAVGLRSSFGNVPLEFMEASISSNSFINHIPVNGVFAMKNAIEERSKGEIDLSENSYLSKFHYQNNDEVIKDYIQYVLQSETTNNNSYPIDSLLYAKTPHNKYLEENPPNIVFLQMESMSSYFFQLHSEHFNMLGSLENELPKCVVFNNFVSSRNFTIFSMDALIVNSQLSPLSQSKYLNVSFPASSILPFVHKGYETEFITGGRLNWRNLDQFLPRQGFQTLEGGADLMKHCSNATEEHEWGVYDEFMMDRIIQKLEAPRTNPVFIYGVTITNHTPYKAPSNYKALPIEFGSDIKHLFNSTDEKTRQTFVCYQYMCNCLGNLIHQISTSSLANNTIVIATGDHTSHVADNLFSFTDKDFMKHYGVPLICYIPEQLKKNIYADTSRFGSHKDIFPTIYNLALSEATYFKSGNNLFSSDTTTNYFGIYEYNSGINKYGCVKFNSNANTFFDWKNKPGGELQLTNSPSTELNKLGHTAKSYSAFNRMQTISQIKNKKNIVKNIANN